MHWSIDYHSGVPVYLQLVQQTKSAVASGVLKDGDQLPSVRDLAERIQVNRNTISKAYAELETEGILENRQGSGAFVTTSVTPLRHSVRARRLATAIDGIIVQAHHLQLSDDTLKSLVDERLEHFHARRRASGSEAGEDRADGTDTKRSTEKGRAS